VKAEEEELLEAATAAKEGRALGVGGGVGGSATGSGSSGSGATMGFSTGAGMDSCSGDGANRSIVRSGTASLGFTTG